MNKIKVFLVTQIIIVFAAICFAGMAMAAQISWVNKVKGVSILMAVWMMGLLWAPQYALLYLRKKSLSVERFIALKLLKQL